MVTEAQRAYNKAYYERNQQKFKEYSRAWSASNPEKRQAWADANKDRHNQRRKEWRDRHPDKCRQHVMDRRARIMSAYVESVDPKVVFSRDGGVCQICLTVIDSTSWHIDHIVPLIAGGEHSYANTQLTHANCNLRKGKKVLG